MITFKQKQQLLQRKKFLFPTLSMIFTIFFQIFGSFMVLLNYYARVGASFLILFTLLTNLLFCNFWQYTGKDRLLVSFIFYANIAVVGGLLMVMSFK